MTGEVDVVAVTGHAASRLCGQLLVVTQWSCYVCMQWPRPVLCVLLWKNTVSLSVLSLGHLLQEEEAIA